MEEPYDTTLEVHARISKADETLIIQDCGCHWVTFMALCVGWQSRLQRITSIFGWPGTPRCVGLGISFGLCSVPPSSLFAHRNRTNQISRDLFLYVEKQSRLKWITLVNRRGC
jgi:hypothetical protein